MKSLCLLLCLASAAYPSISPRDSGRRFALLIGNAEYRSLPKLGAPVEEVRGMKTVLLKAGFDVTTLENGTQRQMDAAAADFVSKLGAGDTVVLYYSGFGLLAGGESYWVPVDTSPDDLSKKIRDRVLPFSRLLVSVQRKNVRIVIGIVDTCLDDPQEKGHTADSVRAPSLLLQPDNRPSFLWFSASPGTLAHDGVFTRELLRVLPERGLDLKELSSRVSTATIHATDGKQRPWVMQNLWEPFSLFPAGPDGK